MTSNPILHDVAAGKPSAMHAFLERYGGLVWNLARRHSRSAQDAEDAVQEIFLELWHRAARFDPAIASEPTFVAMVARRRLIDRLRQQQRAPKVDPLPAIDIATATARPDRLELADELRRVTGALATLRPEQRRVLDLALVHGRSHHEISSETGMPLGTVKSLARRGLLRVRQVLGIVGSDREVTS